MFFCRQILRHRPKFKSGVQSFDYGWIRRWRNGQTVSSPAWAVCHPHTRTGAQRPLVKLNSLQTPKQQQKRLSHAARLPIAIGFLPSSYVVHRPSSANNFTFLNLFLKTTRLIVITFGIFCVNHLYEKRNLKCEKYSVTTPSVSWDVDRTAKN